MRAAAWPPYGPPLQQGDGRSMLRPYTRPAPPATRAGGRAATLFLHSGGGDALDG